MAQQGSLIVQLVGRVLLRLVGAIVTIIIVLGAVLSYRAVSVQQRDAREYADNVGTGSVNLLADLAAVPLEFEDIGELERLTKQLRAFSADLYYVAVLGADGKIMAAEPKGIQPERQAIARGNPVGIDVMAGDVPLRQYAKLAVTKDGKERGIVVALDLRRSRSDVAQTQAWTVGLTLAVTLASAALIWVTTRSIVRRVGDVDDKVMRVVQDLRASASEMLAVAKQTEANATNEAAAVDETQRTMQGLLEASSQIAVGAESVLAAAQLTAGASKTTTERISRLSDQAAKIRDVSEAIQQIADKSDILALNASLEGTKAGDAGRGFALVGAEMRRLAETVMAAAKQIKQLTGQMGDLSHSGVEAVEEGQRLSHETMETSKRITMITAQQRSGTEQVTQSMRDVQQYTEHAVAAATQTKATAEDLVRMAEELTALMRQSAAGNGSPRPAVADLATRGQVRA